MTFLDGSVNVNSLFTTTIFVGLSLTTSGPVQPREPLLMHRQLPQRLKLALNLLNNKDADEAFQAHINLKALRLDMLGSAIGFVLGCLFRLGILSCGSKGTTHVVTVIVVLVSSALVVYISIALLSFICDGGESWNDLVQNYAKWWDNRLNKAVENVNSIITPSLLGKDPTKQTEFDNFMLGANAILAMSLVVCKAGAAVKKIPLYKYHYVL
ncbi:hypothetical protein JHK84_047538 [Glycine max]|nr:hypothetical protein JHK86_047513 [Glycine max]KAG4943458.1 hypothetical protein JHK85_048104 [Glycine max]KAG5102569.1 hypothetical protein JHK84_047538 [Glycine max]